MQESYFRRLLNSLLDQRERANAMAKVAAVVAGLTACALALAPMLESNPPVPESHFAASGTGLAPATVTGVEYLPAYQKPASGDNDARQIETF